MSEHEPGEPEPLSGSLRDYVDAFVAHERPEAPEVEATWSAIDTEVHGGRRRGLVIGVAAAVAIAAAVLLIVGGLDALVAQRQVDPAAVQAPREGAVEGSGGEAYSRGSNAAPLRAESREAEPEAAVVSPDVTPSVQTPVVEETEAVTDGGVPSHTKPRPPSSRSAQGTGGVANPAAPDLKREVTLFKAAKAELDAKRGPAALRTLDTYDREFPRGVFRREAQVLRAQALCASGSLEQARRLRDRFVEAHAGSPLASRMRDVCPG